jgi:O-antigen ligase
MTASHRAWVYRITGRILTEHPVLGIGTRQYEKDFTKYATYFDPANTPDSQYLRMAAENGLVGLAALIGFAVVLLSRLWRARDGNGLAYFAACAVFLVTLAVLDGFYWPAPAMVFFTLAGVGAGRLERKERTVS